MKNTDSEVYTLAGFIRIPDARRCILSKNVLNPAVSYASPVGGALRGDQIVELTDWWGSDKSPRILGAIIKTRAGEDFVTSLSVDSMLTLIRQTHETDEWQAFDE